MHVICHGEWPVAGGVTAITLLFLGGETVGFSDSPSSPRAQSACASAASDTQGSAHLKGGRVDLYEPLMIRQGDIRVTAVQSRLPHGHCAEEKCSKMTAVESKQNVIIL